MTEEKHNIILFGETGAGKSSVVNMIVGKNVANVSNGVRGCTFKNERYGAVIDGRHFQIYDTTGLNEGEQGRVPHWRAIQELYTLIRELNGISLLVYCMRGRIKENSRANWVLFNKVICAGQVPCIVVVTGLEHEEKLEDGSRAAEIMLAFKKYRMFPKKVACVVSITGKYKEHQRLYDWSLKSLRSAILSSYMKEPWRKNHEKWLSHLYNEVYNSNLCFPAQPRVDFIKTAGNLVDEFIREANMKQEDSKKLKDTLLRAENKFLKRNRFF